MIYKNGKPILEIQNEIGENVKQKFGAVYKGAKLVWLAIYNTIRSCFGSGTWLGDKLWLSDDTWKNN